MNVVAAVYNHSLNDHASHVSTYVIRVVMHESNNVIHAHDIIHSKNLANAGCFSAIFAKNGIFIVLNVIKM